jgi:hypothetical protein
MDGTSLDELNYSSAGTSDNDIVREILNIADGRGDGPGGRPPLPILSSRNPGGMQNLPPPSGNTMDSNNTFQQHTMDVGPHQAHVIGNSRPTPADFANLMQGSQYTAPAPQMQVGATSYMPTSLQHSGMQNSVQQYSQYYGGGGSGWMNAIMKESKIPLFVAILVFVVNLPLFNIIISHSFPSLIAITGGLTNGGMLVKALIAGFLFWVIQRILAPLVAE